MAGCRNQGNPCEEEDHCTRRRPQAVNSSAGVSTEYTEYPVTQFRTGNYNIPKRTANAVMHDSIFIPMENDGQGGSTPSDGGASASIGNCGKLRYISCATGFFGGGHYAYDYYPNELSFDWQSSDTWIVYLYDTNNTGVAGTPVYYLETCETTTTSSTEESGTPGDPDYTPGSSSSATTTTTSCQPCTEHQCTPAITDVKYTYSGQDLTKDPDCPFPDLFGIGTLSNKIVFSYNSLSTTLPNGVTDFALSYDGGAYVDVYDETLQIGTEYSSTQNPWKTGDETFSDFIIYDDSVFDSETKSGFRVKIQIEPIIDETVTPAVFTGTKWTVLELMSPGNGYSVNEVYRLTYNHVHADLTESTFEVDLKITSIGAVQVTSGQEGFDVLRTGDTLNGHNILRVYHTDIDNFPYHVAYIDGNGSNFVKDTQYTSSRAHVVTAKAGYGIPDRGCLIGRYEFTEKSIQYVTASIDKNSPDVFNGVKLPEATGIITNGRITGFTIEDPGANLSKRYLNGEDPILIVSGSPSENGQDAEIEGIFVGGQLSSIKIISSGTLYDATDPPRVYISNTYKEATVKYNNEGYEPGRIDRYASYFNANPAPTNANDIAEFNKSADSVPKDISFTNISGNVDIKFDTRRNKADVVPQRLYSKDKTQPLYNIMSRDVDLRHLNKLEFKSLENDLVAEESSRKSRISKSIDDITQFQIPEYNVTPEVLVETVQGRVGDLPYASEYTKYILKQYRSDSAERTTIKVTLSCTPTIPGIDEDVCPPPSVTPDSLTPPVLDPETGVTTSSNTTCVVSGPFGPGCTAWEASGEMLILHDVTRSAATVVAAAKAYGNPLLQT